MIDGRGDLGERSGVVMVEESKRIKYEVWEVEILLRLRQVRDNAQIQSPRQTAFTFPI
jgi:hypothetical protein